MSANVETAKRAIDAFDQRDVGRIADLTTSDFDWFPALPGNVGLQREILGTSV